MSRPRFASIRTSRVEDDISNGWQGNVLTSTTDYLFTLGHFAGAMAVKSFVITAGIVRDVIDNK